MFDRENCNNEGLIVRIKGRMGKKSNPRPSTYKADVLPTKQIRLANFVFQPRENNKIE
jgi:hypothetical protein